jgi:hypothetical protein
MTEATCEQNKVEAPRRWFVLRVQSNREEQVRENLAKVLELEKCRDRVPEILVPAESVTEMRGGKRQVIQRKLYPGYVIVQVEVDEHGSIPQELWQLGRPVAWATSSAPRSPGPCGTTKWPASWAAPKRWRRRPPSSR